MTATITKDEEELLIISDDEETTSEINLDIEKKEEPEIEGEIIDFTSDEPKNETIKSEDTKADVSESIDFNFDLGGEEKDVTVEDMLGKKEETVIKKEEKIETSDDIFDFNISGDEKTEIVEEVENKIETNISNLVENEVSIDFGINDNIEEKEENIVTEPINQEENLVELDFGEEIVEDALEPNIEDSLGKTIDLNESILEESTIQENVSKIESKEKLNNSNKDKIKENETDMKKTDPNSEETIKNENDLISTNTNGGSKKDDSQKDDSKSDDTNTILNDTIKKLKKRKADIVDIKKETLLHITELKEEIKQLQSMVRKGNTEVKHHDKEMGKIEENIQSLRKMRL